MPQRLTVAGEATARSWTSNIIVIAYECKEKKGSQRIGVEKVDVQNAVDISRLRTHTHGWSVDRSAPSYYTIVYMRILSNNELVTRSEEAEGFTLRILNSVQT